MTSNKKTLVSKDAAAKKIQVTREFDAPPAQVWKAWTESSLLDQWWAPKPWKAKTKTQDFREGGHWLYCMEGPEGEQHWCRVDYLSINDQKSYTAIDSFCDKDGNKSPEMPSMKWKNTFSASAGGTKVEVEITFDSDEAMNKILEMGFEEGFNMGLENLDELLSSKK